MSKKISFTTATEYSFKLGYNGSTLTSDYVPGVGLTGQPIAIRNLNLSELPEKKSIILRYTAHERLIYLKRNGITKEQVLDEMKENHAIQEAVEESKAEVMREKKLAKSGQIPPQ